MLLEISSVSNELVSNNTSVLSLFLVSVSMLGIVGLEVNRDDDRWDGLVLSPSLESWELTPLFPSFSTEPEGGFCRFLFTGLFGEGAGAGFGFGLSSVVKFISILVRRAFGLGYININKLAMWIFYNENTMFYNEINRTIDTL